ncbi:MAG: phosphorylase [Candidatus Saccharibacteria bacterium]
MQVPAAEVAIIGGSTTFNLDFPQELDLPYVKVLAQDLVFTTPYGDSPSFRLLEVKGEFKTRNVLCCRMHGWRQGVTRANASRQIFWVFREAGVKAVLAEGGVGSVNHLLDPRDLIIPDDYLDQSMRKDVGLDDRYLLVMRDALCNDLRTLLEHEAAAFKDYRLFKRGIYAVTDGRHFESPAEVRHLAIAGADVVGQSICPEVYLAREIGACYAGIYIVVNYGEGVVQPWQHKELEEIFYSEGYTIGKIILGAIARIPANLTCQCQSLRKETLLKGIY